MSKPRVVIFVEYYLPGFRAGGPMRSVSALVEQLSHEIDFYVITRDRDEGANEAYADVVGGEWTAVGAAKVLYLAPHEIAGRRLVAAVGQVLPRAIYLNGFFGPMAVRLLLARRFGALRAIAFVLAPRGELSPGALRLKGLKKRIFLRLAMWGGLYRGVAFQASTDRERREIAEAITLSEPPQIARNPIAFQPVARLHAKAQGTARFVFVSRIARKKNLRFAIDLLRNIRGSVEFDIYGPIIDEAVWTECRALLGRIPPNVTITYRGVISHEAVASTLSAYDFFLFPTASENFGHAIVEALMAGCPVLTSDQTPWLGLAQRGVGWDLSLDDTDAWRDVLQLCVDMDAATYERASVRSRAFGREIATTDTVAENLQLFQSMFARNRGVSGHPGVSIA